MAQANLKRVIQEIEDLRVHGLLYSAKDDTFLNQVSANGTKAPLGSGDRDVSVETFLPADMAAHVGLLGHGGIRDSKKQFCTNCTCCTSERHTPLRLIRVDAMPPWVCSPMLMICTPSSSWQSTLGGMLLACSLVKSFRSASSLTGQCRFQGGASHRTPSLQLRLRLRLQRLLLTEGGAHQGFNTTKGMVRVMIP